MNINMTSDYTYDGIPVRILAIDRKTSQFGNQYPVVYMLPDGFIRYAHADGTSTCGVSVVESVPNVVTTKWVNFGSANSGHLLHETRAAADKYWSENAMTERFACIEVFFDIKKGEGGGNSGTLKGKTFADLRC